jgi:hypothetical protein
LYPYSVAVASPPFTQHDHAGSVGAAAAFAAADRRRAALAEAKAAWLAAFDAFKAEEARLRQGAEVRETHARAGEADRPAGARVRN